MDSSVQLMNAHDGQAASESLQLDGIPIPTGPKARQENVKLRARIKQLEAELAASQREPAVPAVMEALGEEIDQLKKALEEAETKAASLQAELDTAQQQVKAKERELEARDKDISRITNSLEKGRKTRLETLKDLDRERATNRELHQALDAATQNEQAFQRDLDICKSARDQLVRQVEDLQLAVRKEREQSGWEMATRLTVVLAKLSALASLEPDQVLGLSERAVFEEFRTELGKAVGGRLEPFPARHKVTDDRLWLDADQDGLEALQAQYDWSPERPFEGLPPGSRRLLFHLSRRGWMVGDRVLQRAHVVPLPMESELTANSQPGEPDADPVQG